MSKPIQKILISSVGDPSRTSLPSESSSDRFRLAAQLITTTTSATNGTTPKMSIHDRKRLFDEDDANPSDEESRQADDKKRVNFRFDRLTFSDFNLLKLSLFTACLESLTFQEDVAVINWNQVYNKLSEDTKWQPFQPFSIHRLKVAYKKQLEKILEALPPDEPVDDQLPEFMKIAHGLASCEVKLKKTSRRSSKRVSTAVTNPQIATDPTEIATQPSSLLEQHYVEDETNETRMSEVNVQDNDFDVSVADERRETAMSEVNVQDNDLHVNDSKRTRISEGGGQNNEVLTDNLNSLIECHEVKSPSKGSSEQRDPEEQADSVIQEVACSDSTMKTLPPSNKRPRYSLSGLSLAHVLVDDKKRDSLADFLEEHRIVSSIDELLDAADVSAEGKKMISKQFKLTKPAARLLRPIGEILLSSLITPSTTATTQVNVLQEKLGLAMGDTMDLFDYLRLEAGAFLSNHSL